MDYSVLLSGAAASALGAFIARTTSDADPLPFLAGAFVLFVIGIATFVGEVE